MILNDQYQERFVKEGEIIPLVEKQLTKENIESISTEGDTKILKLSGFNYQDLGFLKPGDIEIRLIKDCDPCVVCKDQESNYFESKRIYNIFSQEVINFIKTFN